MQITVAEEGWNSFWREAEPLMRQHHEEVGTHGLTFELDHERIGRAAAYGAVHFWVARDEDEKILGYIIWYVSYHLFSKGLKVALMGPWYVAPEVRQSPCGAKLWATAKRELKLMGCKVALPHHQFVNEFELDHLFRRQGAERYEMSYFLRL